MAADLMEEEEQVEAPVEEEELPEQGARKPMPPEAKANAQKLIAVAMRVVYKREVSTKLLDLIRKAPRPEVGIGQAVLLVLKLIKDEARGVPPNVINSMAGPVAMMVMEIAEKAGLVESNSEILKMVLALIQRALQMAKQQQGQPAGPRQPAAQPPGPQPAAGPQGILNAQMGGMP